MKILQFLWKNLLFIFVVFLLIFIPLYPKIPLLDIKNTWVYVRLEDFLMVAIFLTFGIKLLFRKATLKTPLTVPIFLFWGVGLISTIIAIMFIFPHLQGVYPNLALLHFARRIEYLGLFFIAYSAIYSKKQVHYVIGALAVTLVAVVLYGVGQKYFGFPAFLTGNEEFAKGIPLRLSSMARIPSTFAGHYDLAAWLVMIIPITGAMIFGYKKWYLKILLFLASFSGLILLLMTASRVSFMVYLLTISFLLVIHKQKKWIIPVLIVSILLLRFFDTISSRFLSTVTPVDLIVDARTGKAVGIAKGVDETGKQVIEEKQSTGESLPEGTGFINIPGAGKDTTTEITYKRTRIHAGAEETNVTTLEGQFVVKKALAYDISFTTRFQGTWPRAIQAFERNIWTGSGYSSISLASDNNYLRILGEVGLVGLLSFGFIFLIFGIYISRLIENVTYRPAKSFILGVAAAVFGLLLNAVLIDVFEASKVAFVLWPLMGLSLGFLHLYHKEKINYRKELIKIFTSFWAICVYLLLFVSGIFSMILTNYFVGDDFTWLRWVADCKKILQTNGLYDCQPLVTTLSNFFTNSGGFFFRPGTKSYFYLMYSFFGLNPPFYHAVSIILHLLVSICVYLLAFKLLKKKLFAFISAFIFLILSVHFEAIFWVSATGSLIAAFCMLVTLLLFIAWKDTGKWYLFVLSLPFAVAGLLFQEFAIVTPLLLIAYDLCMRLKKLEWKKIYSAWYHLIYLSTIPIYLYWRAMSDSHWMGGDYSYNFAKLPFNVVGNTIGYLGITLFGPSFYTNITKLREFAQENVQMTAGVIILVAVVGVLVLFLSRKSLGKPLSRVVIFLTLFFLVSALPFLGLGNIAMRYAYLPSAAIVISLGLLLSLFYVRFKKASIVGLIVVFVLVGLYAYKNVGELRKINTDWQKAGSVTENLLIGFNSYFQVSKATPQNPVFYFVDVPIKTGDAWIFPVGIDDALWFTFQNENLTVNVSKSLDNALDSSEGSGSARVFQFNKDGSVEEVARLKTIIQNAQ